MIVIIDYGVGNPNSIKNMLRKCGTTNVLISSNHEEISNADKLILPGVGSFDKGMENLTEYGLISLLNKKVLENKVPFLGICLGAQLLTKSSEEGVKKGLGWIDAETKKFNFSTIKSSLKIPNMGWADVLPSKESRLLEGVTEPLRFYFVHSYHIVCAHKEDELLSADYGYTFTAAVERNNIAGVQFHPEKSHRFGMKLLGNFVNNY